MNGLYTINAPFFYALVSLNKLSLLYIIIAYLIPMKKQFMTWLLAITTMSAFAQQATVTGPDSFLKVNVSVKQGIPIYSVTYKDKTILEDSPLGFVANVGDFSRDMTFTGQKENKIDKVIDATHPYAVEVSTNAMKACELSNTRYLVRHI